MGLSFCLPNSEFIYLSTEQRKRRHWGNHAAHICQYFCQNFYCLPSLFACITSRLVREISGAAGVEERDDEGVVLLRTRALSEAAEWGKKKLQKYLA